MCVYVCVRARTAFGALGISARHHTFRGVWVCEKSLFGPYFLAMVALDASTSDTHTHTQITSAAAAAAMHKDVGLAHRLTDVALALHAIG